MNPKSCELRLEKNRIVGGDEMIKFPFKYFHSVKIIIKIENTTGSHAISLGKEDGDLKRV